MAKRIRNKQINFRVSDDELSLIESKMRQLGTKNREAYLRKMAIDGYVVKLDVPELKEIVSLMRRMSNNVNQIARRANETGRVYEVDVADVTRQQEMLWNSLRDLLARLGEWHM